MTSLNRAYLSLGANINPEVNMRLAFAELAKQTQLLSVSSVWETPALGNSNQPNYLNCVALVQTPFSAPELRQILQKIEVGLGRVRQANKFAARPMDIDIMLFNEAVFQLGERHIPDHEILERAFVAIPLAEIAPDYVHPQTGQTLAQIAAKFNQVAQTMIRRPDVYY